MTIRKEIGKIKSINFGYGGYQGVMLGFTITLGSDKNSWGVCDFKGAWNSSVEVTEYSKWSEKDREDAYVAAIRFIDDILQKSKKQKLDELKDVPVEVTFENNTLKEWRVLEEVI